MSLKQNPKLENHRDCFGLHIIVHFLINGHYHALYLCKLYSSNHFGANSDQHYLSPNNTNTQWIEKAMGIDKNNDRIALILKQILSNDS